MWAHVAGLRSDLLSWLLPALFHIRKHFFFPALLTNECKWLPLLSPPFSYTP